MPGYGNPSHSSASGEFWIDPGGEQGPDLETLHFRELLFFLAMLLNFFSSKSALVPSSHKEPDSDAIAKKNRENVKSILETDRYFSDSSHFPDFRISPHPTYKVLDPWVGLAAFAYTQNFVVTDARSTPPLRQHNPNSLHYTGGAVDIRVWGKAPAQVNALVLKYESMGFRVIDERLQPTNPAQVWKGPHIHVEVRLTDRAYKPSVFGPEYMNNDDARPYSPNHEPNKTFLQSTRIPAIRVHNP